MVQLSISQASVVMTSTEFNRNPHKQGQEKEHENIDGAKVLTSHDVLGKTGFWLEEFAAPYYVFRDAGVELTLASPKGGQPPLDPKSDLPENQTPSMTRFKKDAAAQKALSNTAKLADVRAEDHYTVFDSDQADLNSSWSAECRAPVM